MANKCCSENIAYAKIVAKVVIKRSSNLFMDRFYRLSKKKSRQLLNNKKSQKPNLTLLL